MGGERVAPALAARGISKRFDGRRALAGVDIAVERGEVHALVGANGSGKSTLAKVLAGYHTPAPGAHVAVAGRSVRMPLRPGEARAFGLRFVHQELGLIPSLSVLENVRMEELAGGRRRWISWSRERERARDALSRFGVELDLRAPVAELSALDRALLAIARAATGTPVALVLDEPTGFLPELERRRVHDVVRDIAGAGAGVLLISHNLAEVRDLARRVTVLRDGRCVATVEAAATGVPELAALVTGRAMPGSPPRVREAAAGRGGAISVSGLSGGVLRGVSLDLRRGEVLGLTGLAGSGYDELPYLLFGARRAAAGRLALGAGHDLTSMTPARAIRAGIALVPSSREKDGAAGSLSLGDNVLLPRLDRYAGVLGLRLDRRRFAADAGSLLQAHGVAPSDPRTPFASLSGGNQQRALVAKWLETDPVLLLLDEPLRGVDAGARGELVGRIRALAGRGAAVVCSSADRDGLDELCDRVLTVSNGRVGCSPSA